MVNPGMVMYEEEFNQIQAVVDRLVREANAKVVFIVDKNGQLIAASGEVGNIDTTSLASLTAGNIAATGGIAKPRLGAPAGAASDGRVEPRVRGRDEESTGSGARLAVRRDHRRRHRQPVQRLRAAP